MRKQYIILETTQFDRADGGDIPEQEAPPRMEVDARGNLIQGGNRRPPRPPALRGRDRPRDAGLEIEMPDRYMRYREIDMVKTFSMAEAEEYIGEALARNPQLKFIILESVAFFETVATPAIKKLWDANGQLKESV